MIEHATALFDSFAPAPFSMRGAAERREHSDIHHHDVIGLIRGLAARYPVGRHLAGDESFLGAARGYVLNEPPRPLSLLAFGETFPRFLRSLGTSASIDYLADIAELELACSTARDAADAAPVAARVPLSTMQAAPLRVRLHPSVSVVASRFPIVTIWEANQADDDAAMIYQWTAEAALVARPFAAVEIRRLPAGGHAFLRALLGGGTIADAAAAGRADAPDFDRAANLAILADARIVVNVMRSDAA
jgi:hypothetical protein